MHRGSQTRMQATRILRVRSSREIHLTTQCTGRLRYAPSSVISKVRACHSPWESLLMSKNPSVGQSLLEKARNWPNAWAGSSESLPQAEALLVTLVPFLESLVAAGLAPTTLHRHFGNIWLMGGELMRAAELDPTSHEMSSFDLLLTCIDEEGGPICKHVTSDQEQRSYDSTCRKLFKFMVPDK